MKKSDEFDPHTFAGMCGSAPIMQTLFGRIERVARSDATVLVTGESGTGKELVARALHHYSARATRPFIALNCSALPADLVESELFGHVRGAFTGASNDHAGLFQAAHGGTLFLDEIGDLAPRTQAKVLRALENGEILRVGSTQVSHVDVRVVAATNRALEEMVAAGTFREDLLYRLKVVNLVVPSLRDRRCDIPLLIQHFLDSRFMQDGIRRTVDDSALQHMQQYHWPGNVRELRNVLAGAAVMAQEDGIIRAADLSSEITASAPLPAGTATASQPVAFAAGVLELPFAEARERALHDFDRYFLSAALKRHDGNIARTARSLGIHRQSLQKLMTKRGLKAARES